MHGVSLLTVEQSFMENNSNLDVKTYPTTFFTCVRLEHEDFKVLDA